MNEQSRSGQLSLAGRAPQAHPHEPSPRNVEIYSRVREHGERQDEVAKELGLSQGRVAQICNQVQNWREWADKRQQGQGGGGQGAGGDWRTVARQLCRRRTQLIFAMTVRSLAKCPHDRQLLKLAAQVSSSLAQQEQGLPPGERLAATAIGRQLEEMLANVVAQLFPTARAGDAANEETNGRTGPREVPNITKFMHAAAAKMHDGGEGRQAPASAVVEGTCSEPPARCGVVMHDKPRK
jgi:hypothetical protein